MIRVLRGDEIRLKYGLGSAQWSSEEGPAALAPGGDGNVVSPLAASTPTMVHLGAGPGGDEWLVAFRARSNTLAVHTYNSKTGRISAANLAPLDSLAQDINGVPLVARSVSGSARDIKVLAWRTNGGGINIASVTGPISATQTPFWQVRALDVAGILGLADVSRVLSPGLTADHERFYLGFISERIHGADDGEPLTSRGVDVLESTDGLTWRFAHRVLLPNAGRGFEHIGLAADGEGNLLVLAAAENPGVDSLAVRLRRNPGGSWTVTTLSPASVFGRANRPTTQHFTVECTRLP